MPSKPHSRAVGYGPVSTARQTESGLGLEGQPTTIVDTAAARTGQGRAGKSLRCALYARVSTLDQRPENQLQELRLYAEARGWTAVEYVDHGVSGAKERRPSLDRLVSDARRRRFDVLVVWRLDRLGRNLRHLVVLLDELRAVGADFVSLNEGIDATTPAGKLQLHILAALAEFERSRIGERVRAGLARVRAAGKRLGRPAANLASCDVERTRHLSVRAAAQQLGTSRSVVHRARLSPRPAASAS